MRKNLFLSSYFLLFLCVFSFAQKVPSIANLSKIKNIENKTFYIENKGQWDTKVSFLTRSDGIDGWVLNDGGMLLDFYKIEKSKTKTDSKFNKEPEEQFNGAIKKGHRISIKWANKNTSLDFEKNDKQDCYYNYLIGNVTSKHASNVSLFGQITGKNLYNGIDLSYYHQEGSMRYDLIVHPNADPTQIKLKIDGADQIKIDANGNVIISTSIGEMSMQNLYVYELETKKQIQCRWIIQNSELTLSLGSYDKSNTLIIDPLIYSTYIGGSTIQTGYGIGVDTLGNAYITGMTESADFTSTLGAYQTSLSGISDVFVSKLNPTGTAFVFSTFIGGSSADAGLSISVDALGDSYITGETGSFDYDITPGAFQTTSGGGTNTFITKLNPNGTALVYSTYLGGSTEDIGLGIAVDNIGNAYITGKTHSTDYPVTAGAFQPFFVGSYDVIVTKLNPLGSSLIYSTYMGGSCGDDIGYSIAVNNFGEAYITGSTVCYGNFITSGVHSSGAGGSDVFVTKLNSSGSSRIYSTCLGGSGSFVNSFGYGIAIDTLGNAYVTGSTEANNFDITSGAYQTIKGDTLLNEAFVFKLNPTASSLVYSTFLGGNDNDIGNGIAIDKYGSVYVTGFTQSTNFPTTSSAFQIVNDGSFDVFVSKLNISGSFLEYSTYIGGSAYDNARAIAIEKSGNAYITGSTNSSNYDITPGVIQTVYSGGGSDCFVSKIDICSTINFSVTSNNVTCNGNNDGSASVAVINPLTYTYNWSPSGGSNSTAIGLAPGTYTVSITDFSGCASHQSITITQPPPIIATINGINSICQGQSTTLNAIGSGVYNWSTGDTTSSITISPATNTIFSLIVSNGSCSDTAYSSIIVTPAPVIIITGVDSICFGQSTSLTATGGGTYSWSTGSTSNSVFVNPISNTTYNVVVANSGCSDSALVSVIVNPLPIATITGTTIICAGQNTILVGNGGIAYNWNTGVTASALNVSPIINTTYSVIVHNTFGCSDTASVAVTVNPLPTVVISGNATVCAGETEVITASGVGNFLWNTGDSTSFISITPTIVTNYLVTASNFCGSVSDSITINVNLLPATTISNDTAILLGNNANINATGGTSYLWLPSAGLSCNTCPNPIASPQNTTTYSVTITGANGCPVIKTITITIDDNFEVFVPDVFSPNGDGQNDILYVRAPGIKELTFIIYDRLGEKVFESNDVTKGWDGTYKGNPLNNGVFVYYISATMLDNKQIKTKGDVTLTR